MHQNRFQTPTNKYCGSLFGLALILFLTLPLFAERLPVKTYTVADGLLRDNVNKIRQDSYGYLWFCTVEGVSRFDGYGFTNITTDDGLPDRHVNDFLETSKGEYLIATDGGLARLNPKGLRGSSENPLFSGYLPANPKAKIISVLFEDRNGTIWAGTSDGLFRLVAKDNQFEFENVSFGGTLTETESLGIVCLLEDGRGALWIGTQAGGLFRLPPNGQIERYTTADGLPSSSIASLVEDKDGRVWAGMRQEGNFGGLCLLAAEPGANKKIVERTFTVKDGLPSIWIPSLFQASDGNFWVGTTAGLCLWQDSGNSVCKTYTAKNDLCDSETWSITEDKDGNLWTGTRCGAKKKARFGFTTYDETDGLANATVNSIFENRDGELFASVNVAKRPVSRFDGAGFTLVKPNFPPNVDSFGWGWMQTVWQDSVGDWWFPTGRGLYRFPKTRFENLANTAPERIETGINDSEVFRVFEDSRGDIWIATTGPNELLRWEREANAWHNYTQEAGFSVQRIGTAFAEDKSGNLWIATGLDDAGLIRYSDGRFKVFTQDDGVPKGWTRDLFLDHAGRLWLANTAEGLLRLDKTNDERLKFVKYTTAEGLSSNGSYCVTEDEFGRIYVGSGRGLDRLNPETGQMENFTTADGLPDSDVEVAYRDRNNALSFATVNGLARFIPEPERPRTPPTILITGLRVAGLVRPISILGETEISNIALASDERQVAINFVGLGANLGEKMRYEYRLTGEDWTQTNERTLNFANLASGDYRFELRAVTADRIYSQIPASLSFRIAAPVWQRWWFILSAIILVSIIIYTFYRYRISRVLAVANMRTRIATDLHDDIGANLTKIAILSEVAHQRFGKASGGDDLLPSIAEISRESVSAMSDIVWAINPKKDTLEDLTRRMRQYAQEVLERCDIRLEFESPEAASDLKLDADTRRNIYLIFKESINNIVRHAHAKAVHIDLKVTSGELVLSIDDDGTGFDTAREYDGNGLLSMTKRATDSGGRLEINSSAGEGTTVILHSPLAQRISFNHLR